MECISETDVQALARENLSGFDSRMKSIPEELCGAALEEARQLETELLMIYRMVALTVRKELEIEKVARLWEAMVQTCDDFSQKLTGLCQTRPKCGAELFYDKVLDLRNKCSRLQMMHS